MRALGVLLSLVGPALADNSLPAGVALDQGAITRWPAVLPCAHPRAVSMWGQIDDDVVWASADGATRVTWPKAQADAGKIRLDPRFPVGRLDQMRAGSFRPRRGHSDAIQVFCAGGDEPSIDWGACDRGPCLVAVSYHAAHIPRPRSVARWSRRFFKTIGGRGRTPEALRGPSTELGRDLTSDLREMIAAACAGGRCSAKVRAADQALRAFLAADEVSYRRIDHDETREEPFGHAYQWKLEGGGAEIQIDCSNEFRTDESPVICNLDVPAGEKSWLRYKSWRVIELDGGEGDIDFDPKERVVSIYGTALELAPR